MNKKPCKICLKPLNEGGPSRKYHLGCFKLYRKEYLKKYNTTVKQTRFSVETLKKDIEELIKQIETLKTKIK